MIMNEGIGGYFELELRQGKEYHTKAIALNTARNCLEYILRSRKYKKLYIPYYTCEVILEPLVKCKVDYEFYHIDENLEPVSNVILKENEAFLYTNYYGLKQNTVIHLAELYGSQLIVDNAQAFFAEPIEGIDTFYSARKFFGVADGAYLYTDKPLDIELEVDKSYDRMLHLLKRADVDSSFGFNDFHQNEDLLINQNIKLMSKLTHKLLASIDYQKVCSTRRANYDFLHDSLKDSNNLSIVRVSDMVPMNYPYLSSKTLRTELIQEKIFVATYWPNVFDWCNQSTLEYKLAQNILPLPIDQRYDFKDMCIMINLIRK